MKLDFKKQDAGQLLLFIILLLLFSRMVSLGLYPLMDTTEARYAEIARKMMELNDWVTPWFDYGVPFWGKPPLSFWMTALSFKIFGINEFAARLPYFIGGVLVIWLVWNWTLYRSRTEALYTAALLCGGLLFYISAGIVMTDMWLLLGTTLSMRGFWVAVSSNKKHRSFESWTFFIGLGIGLLAKGPIAVVLTGIPIFAWLVITKNYALVWTSLPWIRGTLLTILIALPWYVLAELKTPGFLDYFLIGEHFQRFITPGWKGDLYGEAHVQVRGTIWLFMLADWFPWSLIFPVIFLFLWRKKTVFKASSADKQWQLYLLLWGLAPAVFFTAASNILLPYVLPGFPGIALLLAGWLANQQSIDNVKKERILLTGLTTTLIVSCILLITLHLSGISEKNSAKSLIALYNAHKTDNEKIIYYGKRRFSAEFYNYGKVGLVSTPGELNKLDKAFFAIKEKHFNNLPNDIKDNFQFIGTRGKYQLYLINHDI